MVFILMIAPQSNTRLRGRARQQLSTVSNVFLWSAVQVCIGLGSIGIGGKLKGYPGLYTLQSHSLTLLSENTDVFNVLYDFGNRLIKQTEVMLKIQTNQKGFSQKEIYNNLMYRKVSFIFHLHISSKRYFPGILHGCSSVTISSYIFVNAKFYFCYTFCLFIFRVYL